MRAPPMPNSRHRLRRPGSICSSPPGPRCAGLFDRLPRVRGGAHRPDAASPRPPGRRRGGAGRHRARQGLARHGHEGRDRGAGAPCRGGRLRRPCFTTSSRRWPKTSQPFNLFRYITFRSGAATLTALALSFMLAPGIIAWLRARQAEGQPIREDGPEIASGDQARHADHGRHADPLGPRRQHPALGRPRQSLSVDRAGGDALLRPCRLCGRLPEARPPQQPRPARQGRNSRSRSRGARRRQSRRAKYSASRSVTGSPSRCSRTS